MLFTPGPQPRPRDLLDPGRAGRVLRATSCSRARSAAPTCPAATGRTLLESIRDAGGRRCPRRPPSTRATWASRRSAPSAPPTPSSPSSPGRGEQAPGPAGDVRRAAARTAPARASCSRARGRRARRAPATSCFETPGVRGHRAVRARRGRVDGHRQKEMFTFEDKGGRSLTLRPGGHGRGLPRLRRARHAQAPAAGEALVLGPVLPPRGAAGRPLPPVHAGRGRGARVRRSLARRRGRSCCSRSCSRRAGAADLRVRLVEPRHAGDPRASTSRSSRGYLRGREDELSRRGARARSTHNPLRAFDSDHAGTRAVMERRAAAARPARARGRRALRRGARRCSTTPGSTYEVDPRWCAGSTTTRARCSRSSRAARWARRAASGGGGRYDRLVEQLGGPPHPGRGLGRGRRADPAGRRRGRGGRRRGGRVRGAWPSRSAARPPSRSRGGCATTGVRGGAGAGGPLDEGPAEAGGPDRRAGDGDRRATASR